MLRTLFVGLALLAACASPRPPSATPTARGCLRLDERAGVPPSARRACWAEVARRDPAFAEHATLRVRALGAATTDPVVSDTPATLRLAPTPAATLPPPPLTAPPAPASACADRARTCDEGCAGSAAWAECVGRCDTELGRCLGEGAR